MEDRYLFKAKSDDSDRWVKGQLVEVNDTYLIIPNHASKILADWFSASNVVEVKKDTICQCTGLKDKNGNLIWENDILMCHGNKKDLCKVCFGEFKVIDIENIVAVDIVQGWYYKPLETDGLSKCEPFCYEMPLTNYYIERMDAEVIGNIFDNKELLESEE